MMIGALVVAMLGASCIRVKDINYLQDPALSDAAKLFENKKFEYKLQVNDVLSIRVLGLDEQTSRFFNVESGAGNVAVSEEGLYVNGFNIDKNGQIQLPTIGKVKVQGLTLAEAQDLVQRKINEYFTNATVILKMVSFRVSVIGDVQRPGAYTVYNNQINLLEALALAGGANEYADKEHLTLMRQNDRGTQALYIDLSDLAVLSSEYFYLLPNDVIYLPTVQARPGRMNLDLLAILLTTISTVVLVSTYVNNTK